MSVVRQDNAPGAVAALICSVATFIIPLFAFGALIFGIIGLRQIKESYFLKGTWMCWVGIGVGGIFSLAIVLFIMYGEIYPDYFN
jgi:succinate dehydrogenase hydrophobic anchor subunit